MKQPVVGYHKDEDDWVGEIRCGHNRHVRHNPPWQLRLWVITEEGRKTRLGKSLKCKKCDRNELLNFTLKNIQKP